MKWTIKQIMEADFGCEERMPGEPLMVLVCLENEFGEEMQLEVLDEWLIQQDLKEGDEWPEDLEEVEQEEEAEEEKIQQQSLWMESYMEALEEEDNDGEEKELEE